MEHTNEKKEKSKRNIENDNDQELFKIMMAEKSTDPGSSETTKTITTTTTTNNKISHPGILHSNCRKPKTNKKF